MSTGISRVWYGSSRWKRKRAQQLQLEPLCAACAKRGRVTAARVADHVEPHRGDPVKFWEGALASLCVPCHSGDKQALEKSGRKVQHFGADSYPIE
jgi:hypothetical protein